MHSRQSKNEYFRPDSTLPQYLPYPIFLLELNISMTAKALYALLLNRATLSQKNCWVDDRGRVYLVYPIDELARTMGKSRSAIKRAFKELAGCDLVETIPSESSRANLIYMKFPPGSKMLPTRLENDPGMGSKTTPTRSKNEPGVGSKMTLPPVQKRPPSNLIELPDHSHLMSDGGTPTAYGRYENIFLTNEEYETLSAEFPDRLERFLEEMSCYMEASGKRYHSHAAALRIWAKNDKKAGANPGFEDYSCAEGESF